MHFCFFSFACLVMFQQPSDCPVCQIQMGQADWPFSLSRLSRHVLGRPFKDMVLYDSGPGDDRMILMGCAELLDGLARADLWLADGDRAEVLVYLRSIAYLSHT